MVPTTWSSPKACILLVRMDLFGGRAASSGPPGFFSLVWQVRQVQGQESKMNGKAFFFPMSMQVILTWANSPRVVTVWVVAVILVE